MARMPHSTIVAVIDCQWDAVRLHSLRAMSVLQVMFMKDVKRAKR